MVKSISNVNLVLNSYLTVRIFTAVAVSNMSEELCTGECYYRPLFQPYNIYGTAIHILHLQFFLVEFWFMISYYGCTDETLWGRCYRN